MFRGKFATIYEDENYSERKVEMGRIVMHSRQKDDFEHLHFGIRTVKIANYTANTLFNDVYASVLKIMDGLEIRIRPQCKQYADSYEAKSIERQDRTSLNGAKDARVARVMNLIQEQEFSEESEDSMYGLRNAD